MIRRSWCDRAVDKVTTEDVSDLLGLVAGEHSRIARLASDVLAQNARLWSIDDLEPLKRATDPAIRRRGWWLHRSRRGWEALFADREIAQDPDQHLAALGRQPIAPMYFPPDERQRHHIAELLKHAPTDRDNKLAIALAAGLRDLMTQLRPPLVFVMDYLQLDFSAARFSAYVWPKVAIGDLTSQYGDSSYRDTLCAFITHEVLSVKESHEAGLVIRFELGDIAVDPAANDLRGPEIARLQSS